MEVLLGNRSERKELRFRLNTFRLFHFILLKEKYNDVNFIPLSQILIDKEFEEKIEISLFKKGIEDFYRYQEAINDDFNFLPLDRIFVGLYKSESKGNFEEFGGYYSKYQTYYHLEQISLTSFLGCYINKKYHKVLTTLELLRSYFHDSIHYNTFRSYKLKINYAKEIVRLDDVHRFQYGFNFRKEDGITFSSLDAETAKSTRNLGIIMEGVTDDYSKIAVQRIIEEEKVYLNDLSPFENVVLNEIISTSFSEAYLSDTAFTTEESRYIIRINDAYKSVWKLYYSFLSDFSTSSKNEFRDFIFTTMISGDHIAFKDYFNRFANDINGFEKIFKSPKY